jgi:hypothetical protein
MVNKEKKLFKGEWANENVNPEDYIFNDFLTAQSHEYNYQAIAQGGKADKAYECDLCHAHIAWAYYFDNRNTGKKLIAGIECANIMDSGLKAQDYQRAKRAKAERLKFTHEQNIDMFHKEYPHLVQAVEYFKGSHYAIVDIFSKIKWGLSGKQLNYLQKLLTDAWLTEVNKYKTEFKPPAPKLSVGVQTLNVTISNYYFQEKGYYAIEKAVFETEDGQTIFTGKTKQLIQKLYVDHRWSDEEDFWTLDKKERKSELTHNKSYYKKNTEGVLTVEILSEFADDKYSAKIKDFIVTQTYDDVLQ